MKLHLFIAVVLILICSGCVAYTYSDPYNYNSYPYYYNYYPYSPYYYPYGPYYHPLGPSVIYGFPRYHYYHGFHSYRH